MATTKKRKKNKKKNSGARTSGKHYRQKVLTRATESILQCKVVGLEFPGGESRESCRMLIEGGESVIATRRDKLERARIEVQTLQALNKHGAPVPKLLGTNHSHILLQEEIRGVRLSAALKNADEAQYEKLMSAALISLARIHEAASMENLESWVNALGDEEEWVLGLLDRPRVIGKYLKVPAPKLDKSALVKQLSVENARFIKWDSRPGNALVDDESNVIWFDWEHAGKRNRLDDMAWILGDEFIPDYPAAEQRLIDAYIGSFSDTRSVDDANLYLMAYGCFHLVIRLGLILKNLDDEWWDLDKCIAGDKVGVTLLCGQRLCQRGVRWAKKNPLTHDLSGWFEQVQNKLERF